jgi:hypothetical protein
VEESSIEIVTMRKQKRSARAFLNQDFDVSVAAEKGIVVITLTPQKPVQHVAR